MTFITLMEDVYSSLMDLEGCDEWSESDSDLMNRVHDFLRESGSNAFDFCNERQGGQS